MEKLLENIDVFFKELDDTLKEYPTMVQRSQV